MNTGLTLTIPREEISIESSERKMSVNSMSAMICVSRDRPKSQAESRWRHHHFDRSSTSSRRCSGVAIGTPKAAIGINENANCSRSRVPCRNYGAASWPKSCAKVNTGF